jgi:hypothetical protein
VWHRGGAHTDPHSPERIMFIVSFLARPNFAQDPRLLSRGTYFHLKWNMWGHTMKDLMDPDLSMRKPFSILRCLRLWKPANRNWGYDLVTSGFMRFMNEQLEDEDFEERFIPRLNQFRFPKWLRGRRLRNGSQRDTWRLFILETIRKVAQFVKQITLVTHVFYLVGLVILSIIWSTITHGGSGTRLLGRSIFRLMVTHGILFGLAAKMLYDICTSDWGRCISSGKALMPPFPPVEIASTNHQQTAMMILSGPTTFPMRNDVLIGSRYDCYGGI